MKKNLALTSVFVALFAAIICVGCFVKIPLGVVPIVLQNALCILTAIILGGWLGGLPTLLFIVAGAIGLPVFSGGTSGLPVLLGPTGGFIFGYLLGAIIAGFIAGKPKLDEGKKFFSKSTIRIIIAMFVGMIVLYIPGVIRFATWASSNGKIAEGQSAFVYTMDACVIKFLPGDLLKIIVCIPVAVKVRPIVARYFNK